MTKVFQTHYDSFRHCDDYIDDVSQPECLRSYLDFNRLRADLKYERLKQPGFKEPKLFATHKETGKRVRVVMASRFGDVGITDKLNRDHGYNLGRVPVEHLIDFSDKP